MRALAVHAARQVSVAQRRAAVVALTTARHLSTDEHKVLLKEVVDDKGTVLRTPIGSVPENTTALFKLQFDAVEKNLGIRVDAAEKVLQDKLDTMQKVMDHKYELLERLVRRFAIGIVVLVLVQPVVHAGVSAGVKKIK